MTDGYGLALGTYLNVRGSLTTMKDLRGRLPKS